MLIRLIHWNQTEAEERAGRLRSAGYRVNCDRIDQERWRGLLESAPTAIVIDLSRLPSHGREVAMALRQRRGTRHIPLVFVDGDPEKVERIRAALPDAEYTSWTRIRSSLKRAIRRPPADPIVPKSASGPHSGTPLAKKLGIRPGTVTLLIDPPAGFSRTLGPLPAGAAAHSNRRAKNDLAVWFVRDREALLRGMDEAAACAGAGGLWIAWPKKSSGVATDLSSAVVRSAGLDAGLVDFKVCAIDETWSGLRFGRRAKDIR